MQNPPTTVRAKLRAESLVVDHNGTAVRLSAVYSTDPASENAVFSQYTPSAHFTMQISPGKPAADLFEIGVEYYVDISRAQAAQAAAQ